MSCEVVTKLLGGDLKSEGGWNEKISKLQNRIHDLKKKISDDIVQSCVNFMPVMDSLDEIGNEVEEITCNARDLAAIISTVDEKQLEQSGVELRRLIVKHEKVVELVKSLGSLYEIHLYLESDERLITRKEFVKAAESMDQISRTLDDLSDKVYIEAKIFDAIKTELVIRRETLLFEIDECWREVVQWSKKCGMDRLELRQRDKDKSLDEVISSMYVDEVMVVKMQQLADQCLERMFKHVLSEPCRHEVVITDTLDCVRCCLEPVQQKLADQDDDSAEKDGWQAKIALVEAALANFMKVLNFLNDHLLHIKNGKGGHLMAEFGKGICEPVVRLLIDKCLEQTVPDNREELARYEKIVELITCFEKSLVDVGFMKLAVTSSGCGSLVKFVVNIHSHFASRRSAVLLQRTTAIIGQDMLNTIDNDDQECASIDDDLCVKLSKIFDLRIDGAAPDDDDDDDDVAMTRLDAGVAAASQLPRFRISKSVNELVLLIRDTLDESKDSTLEGAERLYETTQNMLQAFIQDAPLKQKELFEIPQAAAVFHNNCWYLSHQLYRFAIHYTKLLADGGLSLTVSYHDIITTLRKLGMRWLVSQMQLQREALDSHVDELRAVVMDPDETEKYPVAERAIKKILMQINQLRKVWSGVLPARSLRKCLVLLVDAAISIFVSVILSVEDLISSASDQLQMACQLFQDKLPFLFASKSESEKHRWRLESTKWDRLNELKLLLGSSLKDIVDRWADGKGPLAETFTVTEVKGMIRALYQNTDYRANAIAKIRK